MTEEQCTEWNKEDWLRFFRKAKSNETLDIMLDRILSRIAAPRVQAEIILGHELRETELEVKNSYFTY